MKQIYFLFVVLLVVMAACGGKKETSVDAEQLMFQIDSVDHVTGLQRMQVSLPTGIFGWGLFSHVIVPGICDGLGFFLALQYGRPHQLLGDSGGRIFGLWFCCNFFGFDILHLSPPVPACPALTLRPAWSSSGGTALYFLETNFQTAPDFRNSGSDHGRHPHW